MIPSQTARTPTEVVAEQGVVVGGHLAEAEAGLRMFQQGGNAVDAIVAAAFTGFVVEPSSCGVGGYGHMAIFLAAPQEFIAIDHYVRAPRLARPDMYEIDPTQPTMYQSWPRVAGQQNEIGHLAPAVPGAVAGLCVAHERYGKLRLAQVLEPAIEAAGASDPITVPSGEISTGSEDNWLDFSELARTLRRIAQEGAPGFYTGPVAEAIDREMSAHGGIMTAADLAAYRPKVLREKPAIYRGYQYVTANDCVGYEALNILDCFDLGTYEPDSVEFRHLMAEALGCAFADNLTHYGDPDVTQSPVQGLRSREFAASRAADIRLDRAAPRPIAPGNPWPYESTVDAPEEIATAPSTGGLRGTSQMAAADREGNLVTLITSLSDGFGSRIVVPGIGVVLNDAMQEFDPRPGRANSIAPGKMPIFGVPSIVSTQEGRAICGGCGSGGYLITTGVLHPLVHALDFGMPIQVAVDAPRVHCQGDETDVDDRIPQAVQERLRELGHRVVPREGPLARVNAILIDPASGWLHAGSGPAGSTAAVGF